MNKLQKILGKLLAGLLLVTLFPMAYAEIAVITNPDVKEIGLSKEKLADIYLGRKNSYSDGTSIDPVDQSEDSAIRNKFYQSVVGMSNSEVNRYWSRLRFSGKGTPPRIITGDQAVRDWVASHPGAIGYIDGKYLNNSVKVVLIIP
jgi:ABC-type phosphate transport system substrate-binding protein